MMKKIISFLLTVSLLLSVFVIQANAEDYTAFKDNVSMLTGLGFINGSGGSAGSDVKRSEFYNIICKLINFETPEQLAEMSIAVTNENGEIPQPNKPITYDEALITAVKALGQGLGLTTADEHLSRAFKLGLTDGLNGGEKLSRADMMQLIVNTCETEVVQVKSIQGETFIYTTDGVVDLLERYHDIRKYKGIVYEADGNTVTTEQAVTSEYVRIDSEVFLAGNSKAENFLGCQVEAYYKDNRGDTGELLYVVGTDKNEVITIQSEDIIKEDTTREELVYEKSGKEKKIKISRVADMVYNGRGYPDFTVSDMTPESGYITVIDNDRDNIFDCIIVTAYITVVVDKASSSYERITGKNGEVIELSEYYGYNIYLDNEEVNLSGMSAGDVIYVMADKDKEHASIYITRNSFEGIVYGFNKTEKTVKIEDTDYKINPEFYEVAEAESFECFKLGKSKVWYLDGDGRVAAYKNIVPGSNNYGWFLKALVDEDTETVTLKILTTEDEWINFDVVKKVKLDGALYTHDKLAKSLAPKQLIRYTLNENGEIRTVETVQTVTEGSESDVFRKMNVTGIYRTEDSSFSSKYYMNSSTIFEIPTGTDVDGNDYSDDPELYRVGRWNYPDYTSYNLEFYDPDKNNCSSVIVYKTSPSSVSTSKSPLFVVSDVIDIMISGEPVQQMRGVLKGHSIQLNAAVNGLFDSIESGDAVQYALDGEGRVQKVSVLYKGDSAETLDDILGAELHNSSGVILKGRVVAVDTENKFIKVQGSTGNRVLRTNNASFSIYNRKKKKAIKASASDIEEGDFVIIYARKSKLYDVCVYKEE